MTLSYYVCTSIKPKFKYGDLIEATDEGVVAKGRIIAVEVDGYKIFWLNHKNSNEQLKIWNIELIEMFYRKVEPV